MLPRHGAEIVRMIPILLHGYVKRSDWWPPPVPPAVAR
jgi:hypothetical protein